MEKQYGCSRCRLIGEGNSYAGTTCPKCGDKMYSMHDERQERKVTIQGLERKLEYLRELRQIEVKTYDEIKQRNDRICLVCDSIEKDLGMSKGVSVSDQVYQCLDCHHVFSGDSKRIDGTRCVKCNGPIVPLRSAVARLVGMLKDMTRTAL